MYGGIGVPTPTPGIGRFSASARGWRDTGARAGHILDLPRARARAALLESRSRKPVLYGVRHRADGVSSARVLRRDAGRLTRGPRPRCRSTTVRPRRVRVALHAPVRRTRWPGFLACSRGRESPGWLPFSCNGSCPPCLCRGPRHRSARGEPAARDSASDFGTSTSPTVMGLLSSRARLGQGADRESPRALPSF